LKAEVNVTFIFEVNDKREDIEKNIISQITSDLNEYWQNDDDTAQMTKIKIKEIKYIE